MKGPKQSLFMLVLLASCILQQSAYAQYDEPNLSCTLPGKYTNDCVRYIAMGADIKCCDLQPVDFYCLCTRHSFPDIYARDSLIVMGYACGFNLPSVCRFPAIIKKGGRDLKPSGVGGVQ